MQTVILAAESAITEEIALHKAVREIRRRDYVLPVDSETKVVEVIHRPETGPPIRYLSVTFLAGRAPHRVMLYVVMVNHDTGETASVDDFLSVVDSMPPELSGSRPPLPITSETAIRTATTEIRKRSLTLPAKVTSNVVESFVFPEVGPDKHVFFVDFRSGRGKHSRQLYKVAVNRGTGEVEFVLDYRARTLK